LYKGAVRAPTPFTDDMGANKGNSTDGRMPFTLLYVYIFSKAVKITVNLLRRKLDRETKIKFISHKSRNMGLRELDIVLEKFERECLASLSDEDLSRYEILLACDSRELLNKITEKTAFGADVCSVICSLAGIGR
jgi:succinate dehydrogenase flavin-adding protein (antitoxin of CptAB toxin-antitoxin module)